MRPVAKGAMQSLVVSGRGKSEYTVSGKYSHPSLEQKELIKVLNQKIDDSKISGLTIQRVARVLGYGKTLTAFDPTGISSFLFDVTEHAVNHRREIRDRQMEKYYQELLNAEDYEFIQSPDSVNLSELDFVALLSACSSELELEKAKLYARLTKSIAVGMVKKEYKRHFILTLSDTAFEDLEVLRLAYVCSKQRIMSKAQNIRLSADEVLTTDYLGPIGSICLDAFTKGKLIETAGLSSIGQKFVQAIYEKDQLTAEALGFEVWQEKRINLCYAGNSSIGLVGAFEAEFRKLRILCTNCSASALDENKISSITTSGTVFVGDFGSADYRAQQNIIKWCNKHVYQSVWVGFEGSGMPDGTSYAKSIKIIDVNNLELAAIEAAKQLKYAVPELLSANKGP